MQPKGAGKFPLGTDKAVYGIHGEHRVRIASQCCPSGVSANILSVLPILVMLPNTSSFVSVGKVLSPELFDTLARSLLAL